MIKDWLKVQLPDTIKTKRDKNKLNETGKTRTIPKRVIPALL